MKTILILLISFFAVIVKVAGQSSEILDINNLHSTFNVNNIYFADSLSPNQIIVTDAPNAELTTRAGLWIGSADHSLGNRKASVTFGNSSEFVPGPIDTITLNTDTNTQQLYNRIWKINRSMVDYFRYQFAIGNVSNGQYTVPDEILTWPATGGTNHSVNQAPFIDFNGDGVYNPFDGDYPLIRGDQQLYWISNDITQHLLTGSVPLNVEVHTTVYGFNCPDNFSYDSLLKHTVFIHYDIYNRTSDYLPNTYLGINQFSQLGNYDDDYIGMNVERNYFYNFNADNIDDSLFGFGQNPPVFNCIQLAGPYADPNDARDNDRDGIVDEPDEECKFSSFMVYNDDFTFSGNPITADHYYNYMDGFWKDDSPLEYGSTGYQSGGMTSKFMFPGDSDPAWHNTNGNPQAFLWDENVPCLGCPPNMPGRRMSVASTGPFTMLPHSKVTLDLAYLFTWYKTQPNGPSTSIYLNNLMVDSLRSMWTNNTFPCTDITSGINSPQSEDIKLYPNPATDYLYVSGVFQSEFYWTITGIKGERIKEGKSARDRLQYLPIEELERGVYFLNIRSAQTITNLRFIKL